MNQKDNIPGIVVVGIGLRLPGDISTTDALWDALVSGKELVTEISGDRFPTSKYWHPRKSELGKSYTFKAGVLSRIGEFDAEFFGISPREACAMDPQQRLLLEVTWEALENANQNFKNVMGSNCGVFVGIANTEYSFNSVNDLSTGGPYSMLGGCGSIAANRISYIFNLQGPSMSIDTACSSSMVALHQACNSIRNKEISSAIVGGVNVLLSPLAFAGFSKAMMLSPTGTCKSFDADANGYVRSEGCVVLYLKSLELAEKDGDKIYGIILNSGVNSDGHTQGGITIPSAEAQAALIEKVHQDIQLSPDDITYVEAHGTGTPVGDPIEAMAIGLSLGKKRDKMNPLPIGSIKSNMGHLETASGLVGVVKALLCFKHESIPATVHFKTPNPHINFEELNIKVVNQLMQPLKQAKGSKIAVNSFGFGGTNAHVVLSEYVGSDKQQQPSAKVTSIPPLVLSVKNELSFKALAKNYYQILSNDFEQYYDIAYTLLHRRTLYQKRLLIYGDNESVILNKLQAITNGDNYGSHIVEGECFGENLSVALVYSGNGSQWQGMCKTLLDQEPLFKEIIQKIDALWLKYADFSIEEELSVSAENSRFEAIEIAQPCLFALQVAMTEYILKKGVIIDAVVGHSVGEIAAAWASGALSLEDAVLVIYVRSFGQAKTKGLGKMAALALSPADAKKMLCDFGLSEKLEIAAVNSPHSVTLSGCVDSLEKLQSVCLEKNIFYSILNLDYAFHSQSMDPIREHVLSQLSAIQPKKNHLPFISTVTGSALSGEELTAEYWWHNIRKPVRFHDGISALIANNIRVCVEVGPHPVLKRYMDDCFTAAETKGLVLPTLKRHSDDIEHVNTAIFKVLLAGGKYCFDHWFSRVGHVIDLPSYPWNRDHYWIVPSNETANHVNFPIEHPLLGYRMAMGESNWENHIDPLLVPYLADHVVDNLIVMPAAAYVEMALAAAHIFYQTDCYEIHDLEILAPIVFNNNVSHMTRFSLAQSGDFQIKSRLRHSEDPWILNVSGRLMPDLLHAVKRKMTTDFPLSDDRELIHVDGETCYKMAKKIGLAYGENFQSITDILVNKDKAVTTVQLSELVSSQLEHYCLHPVLLDTCFQSLIGLLGCHYDIQDAVLPIRLGRLRVYGQFSEPLRLITVIKKQNKRSILADFFIINSDDMLIAEINSCRFRRISLTHKSGSCHLYSTTAYLLSNYESKKEIDMALLSAQWEKSFALRDEQRKTQFEIILPLFDIMIAQFMLRSIKSLVGTDNTFSISALCELHNIAEAQQPLFKFCLDVLIEDGYLKLETSDQVVIDSTEDDTLDPLVTWQILLKDHSAYLAELLVIGRCGYYLEKFFSGKIDLKAVINSQHDYLKTDAPTAIGGYEMIIQMVTLFLKQWPKEHKLRVLEVTQAPKELSAKLLDLFSDNEIEYSLAVYDQESFEKAKTITSTYDFAQSIQLDEQGVLSEKTGLAHQLFDLVIMNEMNNPSVIETLCVQLHKILSKNALLILEASYLDRLRRFISCIEDPSSMAYLNKGYTPDYLQSLLRESGYNVEAPLYEAGESEGRGKFILMATASEVKKEVLTVDEAQWLIFTGNSGVTDTLIEPLREKQKSVCLTGFSSAEAELQVLLEPFAGKEEQTQLICFMNDYNNVSSEADGSTLDVVTKQCLFLTNLVKSIRQLSWHTRPQLIVVTQSGALCNINHSQKNPAQSALWGFVRVLMNEYADLTCKLIDLEGDFLAALSERFVDTLLSQEAESEIVITPTASYGLRTTEMNLTSEASKNKKQDFFLDFSRPGPLDNLQWTALEPRPLKDDEVAIRAKASGLNFRDIMYAMGLIPDEALEDGFLGQTLGMEIAGEIVAVGKSIKDFSVGDKVMGFAPASFSSYAITKSYAITLLPDNWSYADGASIPIAFFTAYYALTYLARIQPGERLLIHGAAGGVGIAAIQLAKYLGADIYVTAGSDEKRDFLRLNGVEHIYDSRDLAFADQILQATEGEGVDVVLNCLAGEAIHANLFVLKPFGRFLELGKRDFYLNSKIGLRPFRNNISFFGIDADQLIVKNPSLSNRLFKEMIELFNEQQLTPLPCREFSVNNIINAFRYMQQAHHIGKIIITFDQQPYTIINHDHHQKNLILDADASYLVTGGLNGFGFRTGQWLAEKGARHLILLGRTGIHSEFVEDAVQELRNQGIQVHIKSLDITNKEEVASLFSEISTSMPPLKGIIHAAAVYDDAIISNLNSEKIERVLAPKLLGALHLHEYSSHLPLDFFVVYSSISALIGNPGQANYAAANAFIESLMYLRHAQHLPGLYVEWGPIEDVGYLDRHQDIKKMLTSKTGINTLTSTQALMAMENLLFEKSVGAMISSKLTSRILTHLGNVTNKSKFELLFKNDRQDEGSKNDLENSSIHELIDGKSPDEVLSIIVEILRREISKILRMSPEKININESLFNIGLDSLMGVELVNTIEQHMGVSLSMLTISQGPTIAELAKHIAGTVAN